MANETTVRTALTPEQWRNRRVEWEEPGPGEVGKAYPSAEITHDGALEVGAEWSGMQETLPARFATPERLSALMALANAALPDGDPRKLTWADVDELRRMANDRDEGDARGEKDWTRVDSDWARTLANRLAALLPPREEG